VNNTRISPSLLAADFTRLGQQLQLVADADLLHVDIMDGHFVPNISFGPAVAAAAKAACDLPLDIHLMIDNPDTFIDSFAALEPEYLTIHYEASPHLHRSLAAIREHGLKAGVSLNPHTPVGWLEPILDSLDLILIMSVNPGFGGQTFIPHSYEKLRQARQLVGERPIAIEVDGGVSLDNAAALAHAGASILVAGSAIFQASDPQQYIAQMRKTLSA